MATNPSSIRRRQVGKRKDQDLTLGLSFSMKFVPNRLLTTIEFKSL
jgi:hypothetical protein